jgi:hypothetical protein
MNVVLRECVGRCRVARARELVAWVWEVARGVPLAEVIGGGAGEGVRRKELVAFF